MSLIFDLLLIACIPFLVNAAHRATFDFRYAGVVLLPFWIQFVGNYLGRNPDCLSNQLNAIFLLACQMF